MELTTQPAALQKVPAQVLGKWVSFAAYRALLQYDTYAQQDVFTSTEAHS